MFHCIGGTATHKSLKTLAVVTAKSEADNRVNSTVCVSHKQGDLSVWIKTTRRENRTVWCTETEYYHDTGTVTVTSLKATISGE